MQITEFDEIVYRIIGTESNVLDGLNVPESSGTFMNAAAESIATDTEQPLKKRRYTASTKHNDPKTDENTQEKDRLKIEWLELQCQVSRQDLQLNEKKMSLLEKDMHLRDLQIIKMERDLNITLHSVMVEENNEESEY